MRPTVRVIEARNLQAMDSNGFSDPFVKLQLGKQRFKTKVIKMNLNPTWDQEFSFLVCDVRDVLKLDVYDEDILQMDDFMGQLRVPLEDVLAAEDLSLGTQWYQLLLKGKTNKAVDCGEICVSIYLESAGATRSWSDDLSAELTDIERNNSLSSQSTAPSIALSYREMETCQDDSINEYSDESEIPAEDKCSGVTDRNQAAAQDNSKENSNASLNGGPLKPWHLSICEEIMGQGYRKSAQHIDKVTEGPSG